MRNKTALALVALFLSVAGAAAAETTAAHDPLADALIAPDVVKSHQQAVGLSDAQRNAIQNDVLSAQQRFTRAQWQLQAATEKLADILKQSHVDQTKALAQMDAVLQIEREVKHTQLTLMIQVKNELTPEQQAIARQFMPAPGK